MRDEVRVLGPLEVLSEQGPVPVGAAKERRLLAALVAEAGKILSADALVDSIWGDAPPRSAPKLLQVYVSKLRKSLPAAVGIRTQGSGYALELQDGVLDAARFERLLKDGREAALAGNPALAASTFGRALTLWRGEAYGELADEDFVRAEARRLRSYGSLRSRSASPPSSRSDATWSSFPSSAASPTRTHCASACRRS